MGFFNKKNNNGKEVVRGNSSFDLDALTRLSKNAVPPRT